MKILTKAVQQIIPKHRHESQKNLKGKWVRLLHAFGLLNGLEHGRAPIIIKRQDDIIKHAVCAAHAAAKNPEGKFTPRCHVVDARLHQQNLPVDENVLGVARHVRCHIFRALGFPHLILY